MNCERFEQRFTGPETCRTIVYIQLYSLVPRSALKHATMGAKQPSYTLRHPICKLSSHIGPSASSKEGLRTQAHELKAIYVA